MGGNSVFPKTSCGAESWNLRDSHMFETLRQLLAWRGPGAKAVVWAHNSHIGDARQTEMGQVREELNIGQLARQHFGQDCALIGMGIPESEAQLYEDRFRQGRILVTVKSGPDRYDEA